MNKLTKALIAGISAAAIITAGAVAGVSAAVAEQEAVQSTTTEVVNVEDQKVVEQAPEIVPVVPVVAPAPVVEAPAPVVEPAPAPEAWTNPDGSVEGGPGCPPPYIDLGYGCQDPICGVDENGNNTPCQG